MARARVARLQCLRLELSRTSNPSHLPFSSASSPRIPILYPLSHLDTDPNLNVSFRTLRLYSPDKAPDADPSRVISRALDAALAAHHFLPFAAAPPTHASSSASPPPPPARRSACP
ncbi:hypothetical protein ACMD2_23297 [Ananas comosus]|uniref:Uncharacterized protein n=1 Tax=Ananas comosus TaxID=4615 RepID=A0A199VKX0_ANACO|nr:hypothetical protein ACMD2_23297 [Ananas comosus]